MDNSTMVQQAQRNRIFEYSLCLLFLLLLALPSQAKFYPSSSTGPAGDEMGKKTRTAIALAISQASELETALGSADADARPKDWPEGLSAFCGTQAGNEARQAVLEVEAAFEQLRDDWDRLSVETLSLKKGWNAAYVYVEDKTPPAAVFKPKEYPARLCARVASAFADPSSSDVVWLLKRIDTLAKSLTDVRQALIGSYISGVSADWPVENVYVYMNSAEVAAQFSTDVSSEAEATTPYHAWSVAAPDALNLQALPAGRVYTTFSTATTSRVVALLGRNVRAGEMTWHKAGSEEKPAEWNFLGLASMLSRTSAEAVMKDLDFTNTECAKLRGTDPSKPEFERAAAGAGLSVADGDVLVADASGPSSWYPAPTVQPSCGMTIAAGKTEATFTLKNDTAAAQTVTGTLHRTGLLKTALRGLTGVSVRRSAVGGWSRWNFSGDGETSDLYFVDTLSAGESRTYTLRFDRSAFDLAARENGYSDGFRRTFSAVLRFWYGSNPACTYLGVVAAPDNDEVASFWPTGLWVGTMSFDKVSQVKGNQTIVHDVPAKGTMAVRAILHVGADGQCRLLHHVLIESVTCSNAVDGAFVQTRLYAGSAKPSGEGTVRRLDSIAMDIDTPIVEGDGCFTNGPVAFAWTMKPEGRGNPFHHPYHPEHDGLQWDFKTPAPSGDDMNNYRQGEIKPETWSIGNKVTIALSLDDSQTASLAETLTGTCTWELGNMRRKVNGENIRASGTVTLQRVVSAERLKTEE